MAQITASMVKELREKTGAGMMDAKKALVEADGSIEAAVDALRKKGLAKAAKKSSRTAAEGLVAVQAAGPKGAIVELNAETDFVARNEEFQAFVKKVAEQALSTNSVEELAAAEIDGKSVTDNLTGLIAKIGENMTLRRSETLEVSEGVVSSYIHGALADGLGKIGVLVALESSAPADQLSALGKQIAMHVAAAFPQYLSINDIDPDVLNREREVLREKHIASGKPAERIDQIVEGDLKKNFYGQICLLEQAFVIDGKTRIADFIEAQAKELGAPIKLAAYSRFQLGEGIEKAEEDFAAEVAKVVNG